VNQGVFDTIKVWASQGWSIEGIIYAEYPLGDHDKEEKKEMISIESRIESRFSGHSLDFKTRSRYLKSPILNLEPATRS
jgi:hypothetical protein